MFCLPLLVASHSCSLPAARLLYALLAMADEFVIVGDCGGTNTRLSLWDIPLGAAAPKRGERAPVRPSAVESFSRAS